MKLEWNQPRSLKLHKIKIKEIYKKNGERRYYLINYLKVSK